MIRLKNYVLISSLNFSLIVLGVVIGTIASKTTTRAQPRIPDPSVIYEEVIPEVSAKTSAFGTVLAGRVVSDQLIVRGIDLVAFYEGSLNLIARKQPISTDDLKAVMDSAKVVPLPRMKRTDVQNPQK